MRTPARTLVGALAGWAQAAEPPTSSAHGPAEAPMFFFYSSGLGIAASIGISLLATLLLLYACSM
jgi:hypothetical protein